MKIVVMMKSNESFKRIKFQLDNKNIEWEEPIRDLDDLREKIVFIKYDIALIDDKIWWKDEAIELLNKFETEVVIFEGDFEKIANEINSKIPKEAEIEMQVNEHNEAEPKNIDTPIRYIEKEVIKNQEVKIKVPVYQEVYTSIPKKLIVIGNLSKRAGATFTTLNLAKAISEHKILVSVIEPPLEKPYIFDTIGLEIRLDKTDEKESLQFYSYPHVIYEEQKIEKDRETIDEGIVWNIPDSRKALIKDWDYYKMMKLLYSSRKASISILDVGSNMQNKVVTSILDEADHIFIIIDPMPTETMQNEEFFNNLIEMQKKGLPIEFIINRWTSGINKKELLNFLKITPLTLIPAIDLKYIHKSIYDCKIPYTLSEVKEDLFIPFNNIIKKIVPNEFLKTEEETKTGFFKKGFFKKIKRRE